MSFTDRMADSTALYQTEESLTDPAQPDGVTQPGTPDHTHVIMLGPVSPTVEGSDASVKMETSSGAGSTATNSAGQQLVYVCQDFMTEEEEVCPSDNRPAPNEDDLETSSMNLEATEPDISINNDTTQPESSAVAFNLDAAEFVCTDYKVPVKEEDVEDDLSQYHAEASAALKAIGRARRDLEGEIHQREITIKEKQVELDRLLRELREVKSLERTEMRKLKLLEPSTEQDQGRPYGGKKPQKFTLTRGKRFDAVLYAAESGHLYISKCDVYLKCIMSQYKGLYCPGVAKVVFAGHLIERKEHNHAADHPDILRRGLVNKVRNALRDDQFGRPIREIFDQVVSGSPHAHLLPFKSIMKTLREDRKRKDDEHLLEVINGRKSISRALTKLRRPTGSRKRHHEPEETDSDGGPWSAGDEHVSDAADPHTMGSAEVISSATAEDALSLLCQTVITEPVPSAGPQSAGPPEQRRPSRASAAAADVPAVDPVPDAAETPPRPSSPAQQAETSVEEPSANSEQMSPPPTARSGPRRSGTGRQAGRQAGAVRPPQTGPADSWTKMMTAAEPELQRYAAFMLRDSHDRDLAIAFTSREVTTAAKRSNSYSIQLDASSKLSPPVGGVFSRLLLVSFSVRRQLRPGFFVLLRDPARPAFAEVFRMVKGRLVGTVPEHVVCASDPTLLGAAGDSWPAVKLSCSVSQFCRDLLSKVASEDLSAQFASWPPVRGWLTMLLAVPFLPPDQLADVLTKLANGTPKNVDARTRQCLRKLSAYVTDEWLWKLGAGRLSVLDRPGVDELDTIQVMRRLQSRYQVLRSTAADPAADHSRGTHFRPFVLAVNEMVRAVDRAVERDQAGPFCWPKVHQLERLVVRLAPQLASRQTTALAFLEAAGEQLVSDGLPPGTGISCGEAAATSDLTDPGAEAETGAGWSPDTASSPARRSVDKARRARSKVSLTSITRAGRARGRGMGGGVAAGRATLAHTASASANGAVTSEPDRTIAVIRTDTGGDGPGAGRDILREVQERLRWIREQHRPGIRRSRRTRPGPPGRYNYSEELGSESDPLQRSAEDAADWDDE